MGPVAGQIDQPVILDNTVLTNLALVGRADLVTHLWPATACTTPSVLDEYRSGAAGGWVPADAWAHLTVVTMTEEETALTARFSTRLGAGERSCLAVAVRRRGLLASDDLDARRIAQQQKVSLTGTISDPPNALTTGAKAQSSAINSPRLQPAQPRTLVAPRLRTANAASGRSHRQARPVRSICCPLTAPSEGSLCRSYCPESTRRSSPPVERTMVSTVQSNGRSLSRPLTPGGF